MVIDFSKLESSDSSDTVIHPREIYSLLIGRDKTKHKYLRDVQTEVLNKWFDQRNQKDSLIKMNTGSGKTLIGLLILKSCLNEGEGPAVYVVPDPYLVNQVIQEAKDLSISVTTDADSPSFLRCKDILVINVHKLFNGQSVFGVGSQGVKKEIGSIIVDDAHACIAKISEQFTLTIPRNTETFNTLFKIFSDDLKGESESTFIAIEDGIPFHNMLLPFWSWQNRLSDTIRILNSADDLGDEKVFKWPLVLSNLIMADCVFHTEGIELSLRSLPIHIINSFDQARRRLIMSATLPDDSEIVTHLGLSGDSIINAISPQNANDIGDRMILVPQELNPTIGEDDIKDFLVKQSKNYNVVVIVPSYHRAEFWSDEAKIVINKDNIDSSVSQLKGGHIGLVVIVNKYDGIDLPGDACRILVIDGLPDARSEINKIDTNILRDRGVPLVKKIQTIEQGMGRGVRSEDDYSVVFLMGSSLVNHLYARQALDFFTMATKAQLDLSEKISDQIRNKDIDTLKSVIEYSLNRNDDWIKSNKSALLHTKYNSGQLNAFAKYIKPAFDLVEMKSFDDAVNIVSNGINLEQDKELKGLLKYYMASLIYLYDKNEAQVTLRSALTENRRLPHPIDGISYSRLKSSVYGQAEQSSRFLSNYIKEPNLLLIRLNQILGDLIFLPDTSNRFEEAFKELAYFLGFESERPENEYRIGPDVLWAIGDLSYFVIECKNGATTATISKRDCNQLNGSMNWFSTKYDQTCTSKPILIHCSGQFEFAASPTQGTRIITEKELTKLKSQVLKFVTAAINKKALAKGDQIAELLRDYDLEAGDFLKTYTVKFSKKRQ